MQEKADIERELRNQGLEPRTWSQTLDAIKAKLEKPDWEAFSRLHRNFVGYRSDTTLSRFYGFVFTHGLQIAVNDFRFRRLTAILEDLLPELTPGLAILDVGAGAGIIAAVVKRNCAPRSYTVQDPCREVRDELAAQGYATLPHPVPDAPASDTRFDVILCADSLGEVNADDDGLLAKSDGAEVSELPGLIEERYGFAEKLRLWKPYLAPGGRILLWEPFAYPNAMEALAVFLRESGWNVLFHQRAPGRNYLEIRIG
ncbi:MAG: hypothetical protein JWP91_4495 [Fibrobacteres bacterium]|nr:hypothetical protein [Fibrobacterota bacterium]